MIHSCAGGVVREKRFFDFAKVQILDTGVIAWYVCDLPLVAVGDVVIVPFGKDDARCKAKVLRLDRGVSEQTCPVPAKHAKAVLEVCTP